MYETKNSFEQHKKELLSDPEFKKEYENLQPEYEIMKILIDARCSQGLTQKELAKKTGIRQSNISRIERGKCSPTIETLKKLADGLGMKLNVQFVKNS